MADPSVLIIGAGPTGLVLALWLTQQGVSVRTVDKAAEPDASSRALAVHARTLELYRQLGLDTPVMAQGYTVPGVRLWIGGREKVRVPFNELVSHLTPYGFLHIFPQDEHERLLIERLEAMGVQVERSTECLGYDDQGDRIVATLRAPDGQVSQVQAAFIAGCDGARSAVREATVEDGLQTWCGVRGIRLERFAWTDAMERSGLRKNALYLLRPDTYVALAQADQATAPIDRYFEAIGLSVLANAGREADLEVASG